MRWRDNPRVFMRMRGTENPMKQGLIVKGWVSVARTLLRLVLHYSRFDNWPVVVDPVILGILVASLVYKEQVSIWF